MAATESQYTLRHLFFLTACMAFASWLIGSNSPFLSITGIGVMMYLFSRGCGAVAERTPKSAAFIPHALSALAIGFALPFILLGMLLHLFGFSAR